jgi:hypothetical protein
MLDPECACRGARLLCIDDQIFSRTIFHQVVFSLHLFRSLTAYAERRIGRDEEGAAPRSIDAPEPAPNRDLYGMEQVDSSESS